MKVKIFQFANVSDGYYGDYETVLTQGISDWEEVTEEEYKFIQNNLYRLRNKYSNITLIVQPDVTIPELIIDIKDEIAKALKAEQRKKEEALRKKQEANRKKAEKAKEKELIQLKKLQEKYGV